MVNRYATIPFHLQNEIKQRGVTYLARCLPLITYVEVDGHVMTGQNP